MSEQYSYGWFVPLFTLVLLGMRWENRPAAAPPDATRRWRIGLPAAVLGLAFLPLVRLFEVANPDWRLLGWLHAAAVAGLTLLAIWAVGGVPWLRHFAFPILFFFTAVPWTKNFEESIVQGLMHGVAGAAAGGLELLGIPAQLEGNLIRVASGVVGVNEACSGVRSLQTSLMIGLLFGELAGLRVLRRVALVAAAAVLALLANVFRAFLLVWIAATQGVQAAEQKHDLAGYVILAIVFGGSVALAAVLRPRSSSTAAPSVKEGLPSKEPPHGQPLPLAWMVAGLCWLLLVEGGVEAWYRWHERDLISRPEWAVRWPRDAPGFHAIPIDERTRRILRFDEGRAAAWRSANGITPAQGSGDSPITQPAPNCVLYFFRWRPGHNSALLAGQHRPDICFPAAGWTQTADLGLRFFPAGGGLLLPFRHFEFSHPAREGRVQVSHVFYCLWEDKGMDNDGAADMRDASPDPSDFFRSERWKAVWEGRRHLGQQVMELTLTGPADTTAAEADATFGRLVSALVITGSPAALAQTAIHWEPQP